MFGESFRYATAVPVDQPAILPVRRPRWQKPGFAEPRSTPIRRTDAITPDGRAAHFAPSATRQLLRPYGRIASDTADGKSTFGEPQFNTWQRRFEQIVEFTISPLFYLGNFGFSVRPIQRLQRRVLPRG
jgi:hypothetical protein